jgi:hypothetical protein
MYTPLGDPLVSARFFTLLGVLTILKITSHYLLHTLLTGFRVRSISQHTLWRLQHRRAKRRYTESRIVILRDIGTSRSVSRSIVPGEALVRGGSELDIGPLFLLKLLFETGLG